MNLRPRDSNNIFLWRIEENNLSLINKYPSYLFCTHIFPEQSKANEEKFKKMKDVYQKLRDEHVTLLRQVKQSHTHCHGASSRENLSSGFATM